MSVSILIPIKDYVERNCYEACRLQTQACQIIINQMDAVPLDDNPQYNKTKNSVRNRNELRKIALGSSATHFMLVDSDTVLPLDCVEKLLAADKDIISAWCPMANAPKWIAGYWDNHRFAYYESPLPGIAPVDMAPLGCMLVRRAVLERLTFDDATQLVVETIDGQKMYAGVTLAFALLARAAGYDLYMHGDLICKHIQRADHV